MTIKKFDLETLNGFNGFKIMGTGSDGLGYSVSGSTNFNGDSFGDIIISAINANQAYVLFGNKTLFPTTFQLSNIDGENGFAITTNMPKSNLGVSTAGGCDFNSDGYQDVLIGAPNVNISEGLPYAGQAYVIFGHKAPFKAVLNLKDLDGVNGFTINGLYPFSYAGTSVACLGDVNNDGNPDIAIGAPGVNNKAGVSYVIFGTKQPMPASFDLSTLSGTNGITLIDPSFNELSGTVVAGIGDINNDGIKDIGIGAPQVSDAGFVYVLFGNTTLPASINFNDLNGNNGFRVVADKQGFGGSISSAGDINMDEITDFVIGSRHCSGDDTCGSRANILFGSTNFTSEVKVDSAPGFSLYASHGSVDMGFSVSHIQNFLGNNKSSVMACDEGVKSPRYPEIKNCVMLHQNPTYSGDIDIDSTNFGVIYFYSSSIGSKGNSIAISSIGDFNGDNITDLAIGTGSCDSCNDQAFVVFGNPFYNASTYDVL